MKYAYCLNNEDFHDIDWIIGKLEEDKNITSIFIGEKLEVKHSHYINSENLIENMQSYAYDDVDELASDYLEDFTKENREELNKIISDYLDENIAQPNFWKVKKLGEITVDDFYEKHYECFLCTYTNGEKEFSRIFTKEQIKESVHVDEICDSQNLKDYQILSVEPIKKN